MDRIREAVRELVGVFQKASSKHEANQAAAPIMEQLTRQPAFLTAVLSKYLMTRGSLDRKNYPVVGMEIASNPWFGLVANCWIPLPGRETHISTKAIHHHGNMLLTTATLFGSGYEHWMFSQPKEIDRERGIFEMALLEAAPHPQHHVSFVDAWIAHTPFYPKELSITLALWSNRFDTTWRDHVKRLPGISENANVLRDVAVKMGLRRALDLKVVESYDFFPAQDGFQVMRERKEFELGPVEDHIHSVFHDVQRTGNEHLGRVIRKQLDDGAITVGRPTVERLLVELERGTPIEGRLSSMHHGIPYANFTREDVLGALRALGKKVEHGGKFAPAPGGQETARASAH
jgi:hypothetical protein